MTIFNIIPVLDSITIIGLLLFNDSFGFFVLLLTIILLTLTIGTVGIIKKKSNNGKS